MPKPCRTPCNAPATWAAIFADQFVGMYVNHWTLDYGERGREAIRQFLGLGFERGLLPHRQELEFVV